MRNYTRRQIIGTMFVDAAKYILTIVVIGALVAAEQINTRMLTTGVLGTFVFITIGYWIIPQNPNKEDL